MFSWFRKPVKPEIDGKSIAKCETCFKLLRFHRGRTLITHLIDDHRLTEDAAIETVAWIYRRIG